MHLSLGTIDHFFHYYGPSMAYAGDSPKFTVVINTYKRPERLAEAVRHYADTWGRRVDIVHIFILSLILFLRCRRPFLLRVS